MPLNWWEPSETETVNLKDGSWRLLQWGIPFICIYNLYIYILLYVHILFIYIKDIILYYIIYIYILATQLSGILATQISGD